MTLSSQNTEEWRMCLCQWPCKIKTYQNSHNLSLAICKLGITSRIFKINIIIAFNKYCSKYIFLPKIQFH